MSTLVPYPAYKPTAIPWLQQVPEHWDMVPNRGLVRKRKVLVGKRHKEYKLLSLTKQGVIIRDISTGKGKFSADMGTSQEVRRGDLVFCLFDVPETPRTVGLSPHDGMITGAYTVFDYFGAGNADYFEYFYRAMDDRKMLGPLYSGLRNTIPLDRLLTAKTPQPPIEEQHLIVRYLHALDAKVKRYIRAKRSLIARLQEQKQAIIQRAVTRGLDPNVKLKPSGVEWLGEVPEHWEVKKIKQCASRFYSGGTPESGNNAFYTRDESGIPWLLIADLTRQRLVRNSQTRITEAGRASRRLEVLPKGTVVVSMYASLGAAAILDIDAAVNQAICGVQVDVRQVRPEWLLTVLEAMRPALNREAKSSTQANISAWKVKNLWIPVPSNKDQDDLLQSMEHERLALDSAISRTEQSIMRIHEYHTRLIADVVTGAVDVRAAAQALPADQMISGSDDQTMEEEPLNMAAEGEEEYNG